MKSKVRNLKSKNQKISEIENKNVRECLHHKYFATQKVLIVEKNLRVKSSKGKTAQIGPVR